MAGDDDFVDYVTAWKVLNTHVESMADEGHRLSNTAVPNGNFELLLASMVQGQTLADGLQRMAAGARILRPDLTFKVALHSRRLHLSMAFATDESPAQAVYLEAMATVVHCAVRWALGVAATPARVVGPVGIDPAGGSWLNLLGPPVLRQGRGVTVVYPPDCSGAPLQAHAFGRWHDATFSEYVRLADRAVAGPTGVDPSTTRRVRDALIGDVLGQAAIARSFGMSVPTLRRRLTEEGATFRKIQADLRRDAAEVLLLGDKSVAHIATELGLSDSRCFRRACRSWFGASPSAIRRSLRQAREVQTDLSVRESSKLEGRRK
jgi:AraC-like DNA-binding protein